MEVARIRGSESGNESNRRKRRVEAPLVYTYVKYSTLIIAMLGEINPGEIYIYE
jgi:hypothetical protein